MKKVLILSLCCLFATNFIDVDARGYCRGRRCDGHYYHRGHRGSSWAPLAGLFMFSLANMNRAQQTRTLENKIDELVDIIKSQSDRIKELQNELERCKKKGRII